MSDIENGIAKKKIISESRIQDRRKYKCQYLSFFIAHKQKTISIHEKKQKKTGDDRCVRTYIKTHT